jgi:hypothetical protein
VTYRNCGQNFRKAVVRRATGKPTLPIETTVGGVQAMLAGEMTAAEATQRHGVNRPSDD